MGSNERFILMEKLKKNPQYPLFSFVLSVDYGFS